MKLLTSYIPTIKRSSQCNERIFSSGEIKHTNWLLKYDLTKNWKILTPLQKLPKNVDNLGKIIDATGFEKLPKVE